MKGNLRLLGNNQILNSAVARLWPPLILMFGLLLLVEFTHWDEWISGFAYDPGLQAFPMKRNFLFDTVLHDWARNIPIGVAVCSLIALASTVFRPSVLLRQMAIFTFVSMLFSTGLVALLKSNSLTHCPYDIVRYGGQFQDVGLLDFGARFQEAGKCWPSGHASSGFSLLALYFVSRIYKPEYRIPALMIALTIGFLFTASQTIRGAHYFSHGLWSLLFVWLANELLCLFWSRWNLKKQTS